ncbi:hypothetical protein LIER_22401 [Lithospermum erythrorhizon]|uniref:Uncharacterized protein n=1 Tax=Lithospermum erythrorhizon TaxID=34254 RepID=A0AAV3QVC0_LITER
MVRTRRGVNTPGKATKGKKNGGGPSDDACMVVEPPVVDEGAQDMKGRKSKAKGSQAPASMSTSKLEEPMFYPTPYYTNVRELDNPRASVVNRDDDVGGEDSHDEFLAQENVIGEVIAPIVEEKVIDSSYAETSDTTDVLEPSIIPTVDDTTGKTVEPSLVLEKATNGAGDNVPEGDSVDVSHAEKMVTEEVVMPSTEGLGVFVDPSVKDTLDGLKDSTPRREMC